MDNIKFSCKWTDTNAILEKYNDLEVSSTMADLKILINEISLTKNINNFYNKVSDSVLVSAYPLAMWLAYSWWRINFEPLPNINGVQKSPSIDWRMAHELGAANHGFIWPNIIFIPDGNGVQVWSTLIASQKNQSVEYIDGLASSKYMSLDVFQSEVDRFMEATLSRLNDAGLQNTDLERLWSFVIEDRHNPEASQTRKIEAQLGYDPEECPDEVMRQAIDLKDNLGVNALSELAPAYGNSKLGDVQDLVRSTGIYGKPQLDDLEVPISEELMPWRRGVELAKVIRRKIGNPNKPIKNKELYDLLGISEHSIDSFSLTGSREASIAAKKDSGEFNFIPRKRHNNGKRFEFSRFLGDLYFSQSPEALNCLVSTDLSTSRQKYQRAFAAEFLCPTEALISVLENDFSEEKIEEASSYFDVSPLTVQSLLSNNGYIQQSSMKYDMSPYQQLV